MWIGIDDTDSPRGGCTTYTLTEVIRRAAEAGFDLIGEPRLVRLNPNVPMKTRGNAALAARFGHGTGGRRRAGAFGARTVRRHARGRRLSPAEATALVEIAWETVLSTSMLGDSGTDPVLVASPRRLPSDLYRTAVSRLVDPDDVLQRVRAAGAIVRATGDPAGVVGASAAIAWPGARATWELLAYRRPSSWGSARDVRVESVRTAERRWPSLFLCSDPATRRVMVVPHTPCPILFGFRSRNPRDLPSVLDVIESEPVDRWLVFRTNQATGDHLVRRSIIDLRAYDAARIRATVTSEPTTLPGGHVAIEVGSRGTDGRLRCVAFEPTKTLPAVVRQLRPGDVVELWGGRGLDPTFRLEGIHVRKLAASQPSPPPCRNCRGSTHSIGRGRGYRCDRCRARYPPEEGAPRPPRPLAVGVYHPTPSARRHLAPLASGGGDGPDRRLPGPTDEVSLVQSGGLSLINS